MIDIDNEEEFLQHIRSRVMAERPSVMYKFCSTGTAKLIIGQGTLKFDTPLNFNDPFDCQLSIESKASGMDIMRHLKRYTPQLTPTQRLALVRDVKADPDRFFQAVNTSAREMIAEEGVCCFCKGWEEILLWSYYANNHKGVALGFVPNVDPLFTRLLKVNYVAEHQRYNYIYDRGEMLSGLLTEKYIKWEHEQEIRALDSPPGMKPFRPTALQEVIFGCKCSDEDISSIKSLCSELGWNHIVYWQASKAEFKYAVERRRI